ncbi:CND2 protein, partial [Atractosteus spatula]|nr:CND2 protein [Atractosteus spatula]
MSASSTPRLGMRSHVLTEMLPGKQFVSPSTRAKVVQVAHQPLLNSCPSNDDDLEKRQRRRSRVIDLHMSGLDGSLLDSPARSGTGTPAAVPKLSNSEISEHYSTCIKLSTENKITTKNAFGLHLIDYMSEILRQKETELTNFKVAAGTLDASTKIYSVRVDAVHADTYRVLGGLGSDMKQADEKEPEDGEENSTDPEVPKKVVKKKNPNKKTVEQNLNNINSAESERKCEVDPMFQKMASSFDETSTAGVFLSVLFSEDCSSELRFPSDVVVLSSGTPCQPPPPAQVPASPFTAALQQAQEKSSICPSLEDFSFTNWSDKAHDQNITQMLEKYKSSNHVFDINAEPEPECEPADGGDDFDADAYEDGPEECGDGDRQGEHRSGCMMDKGRGRDVIPIGEGDIGTMCLQLSSQPGEYSYFSPRTMSMWAGPGHWRFKPRHKQHCLRLCSNEIRREFMVSGNSLEDHEPDKENKKRKPKKAFELNFNEDVNFEIYFRKTRAATTNTKSALDTLNKKTTLPADFHYEPDCLAKLSYKPSNTANALLVEPLWRPSKNSSPKVIVCVSQSCETSVSVHVTEYPNIWSSERALVFLKSGILSKLTKKRISGDNLEEIGDYNYDNPNDTANFCPDIEVEDDEEPAGFVGPDGTFEMTCHPGGGSISLPAETNGADITTYGEDNLVAEPHKVNKIEINYAKTAKKMDMKKLKHTMWNLLTDQLNKSAEAREGDESAAVNGMKAFSQTTKSLLQRLPSNMAQNLSVPLAFAALLHLANEKQEKEAIKASETRVTALQREVGGVEDIMTKNMERIVERIRDRGERLDHLMSKSEDLQADGQGAVTVGETRVKTLQSEVDGVKEIMTKNVERILERGERLDDLMGKTEDLQADAQHFKHTSTKVARSYWWKNVKLIICIVVVVVIIILIIILLATGVIPTSSSKPSP